MCRLAASASAYTATPLTCSSRKVRRMRQAMAPRLAINSFSNMGKTLRAVPQSEGALRSSAVPVMSVGGGAPDGGEPVGACLADSPPSGASPLPHASVVAQALPASGLAQGEQPTAQALECQFHTSNSAGVGL